VLPRQIAAVTITQHRFATGRGSSGAFRFHNKAPKPVHDFTLVLDYTDDSGKPLFAMVYQGVVGRDLSSFNPSIQAEYIEQLTQMILPGESVRVAGESAFVTLRCPAGSRLTKLGVTYDDGSSLEWSEPGWRTEPFLLDAPDHFQMPGALVLATRSEEFALSIRIDPDGQVAEVVPVNNSYTEIAQWLHQNLRRWKFFPALREGEPTPDEVSMLVRLWRRTPGQIEGRKLGQLRTNAGIFLALELMLEPHKTTEWAYSYSGSLGGSSSKPTLRKRDPN